MVTPFGGAAVFIFFLRKIDLVAQLRRHMPLQWRSPNHIDPTATFVAFLITVLVGTTRVRYRSPARICAGGTGQPASLPRPHQINENAMHA